MKTLRYFSLAAVCCIAGLFSSVAIGQQTESLDIDARGDSRIFDVLSDAFAQINVEPDGFWQISSISGHDPFDVSSFDLATFNANVPADPTVGNTQFGTQDVFQTETTFSAGSYDLTYDDAAVSGSGIESATVNSIAFDFSGDIGVDFAGIALDTWTVGAATGSVDLLNGDITGINASAPITVTTTGAATLSIDGDLTLNGDEWQLSIDQTQTVFLFGADRDVRTVFDVGGSISLAAVPEPSGALVLLSLGLVGMCRRKK